MVTDELEEALRRCREAWPSLDVASEGFGAYLEALFPAAPQRSAALASSTIADLYLAHACLAGDRDAIAAFQAHCGPTVRASLRRLALAEEQIAELSQQLWSQMFFFDGERPPLLSNYAGRGRLGAWASVVTARLAMRRMGVTKRELSLANDVMDQLFGPSEDPEIEHLKEVYREEFRRAFGCAINALTPRQRTLLRQRYLDGVEVSRLARMYHTHRATISRWLAEARADVGQRTRDALADRLAISPAECDSVLRLIQTRMDITLSAFGNFDEG